MANPDVRVELSAFTDSKGPELYNLGLSVKRADAATKYLGNKGISGDRITNKFYGSELLAANCNDDPKCIEEARKENRRIEIRLLGD
jgi:outer membrane protein OmpA-like peptidoglycan-associated protein